MVSDIKNFKDFSMKAYGLRKYIANLVYINQVLLIGCFRPAMTKKN